MVENQTAVILPTYNEKENIERLINSILSISPLLKVIVVDDNSPDKTGEIVERISKDNKNVYLIKRERKLGLGTAYIDGFLFAEKRLNLNYVITMDCDFSHNPEIIPAILKSFSDYDVVIGSRYIDSGRVVDSPFIRRLISKTANFFTSHFLGLKIKDATSGFRGYKIEVLKKINYNKIFSNGYSFLIEIIYKISLIENVRIKEIPITFIDRKEGKSKISKSEILKAIKTIVILSFNKFFLSKKLIKLIDTNYLNLNPINYLRLSFHTSRYKKVKRLLKEGNILDIGCARPAEFMNDQSFLIFIANDNAIGVDIKEIENSRYKFVKADILSMPFKDESFDNITMMELIEHIPNVDRALVEVKRVLKKDGILIIVTPDDNLLWQFIWNIWSNSFGKMWKDQHISNYTLKDWERIISRHFIIKNVKRSWYFDLIFQCQKK